MNILFVASECAPFVKTGGLADVIGAVPKSLASRGASVRVLMPGYPALATQINAGTVVSTYDDLFGGAARVVAVSDHGIDLLILDAPHLFDRAGNIYLDETGSDWADNHLRFGALSRVGADVAMNGIGDWTPDLVNAHDWQAGLVPAYIKQAGGNAPPVVMTIHNIAFQGLFDSYLLGDLGLSADLFTPEALEYYGRIGFLKGGLALCDKITTVSPTYARELMTADYGMGLEGLLRARQTDVSGILNGIDIDVWNPETDATLPQTYTARSLKRKTANRDEIRTRFGLSENAIGPLLCVISRLTEQKGLDLLLEALPTLVGQGAQLALLGSGNADLEDGFVTAAKQYKGAVGTIIGYDENLSHLLQGGSDAILIPSRFEPCGLTQLYGLRYGTLPVVANTGGLADTVIDANEAAILADCATGVQFTSVTTQGVEQAIIRTCDLFKDKKNWAKMVRRAMGHPVDWDRSAEAYLTLFTSVIDDSKR